MPPFDIKDVILFSKQSQNNSQASFPTSHLNLCKSDKLAVIFKILQHANDFRTIGHGGHIAF